MNKTTNRRTPSPLTKRITTILAVSALGLGLSGNTLSGAVDPSGLLLELRFDGNTQDSSGSGYDMTNFGAMPTTDRHGNPDSAYFFDGIDDYMRHTGASMTINDFTLSLWVTTDTFPNWYRYAFAIHSGGGGTNNGDRNIGLILANNNQIGGRYTVTEGQNLPAVEQYVDLTPLGSWKHIVYVREGNEQRLYFDGALASTFTDSQSTFQLNNGLIEVGAPNFWNGGWSQNGRDQAKWHGSIDDLLVYSRALDDSEIEALHTEGQDDDGDGVPNDLDLCPDSDLSPIVVIGDCDTGVENRLLTDGCTLSDLINELKASARNHGVFVRQVVRLTIGLRREGVIDWREKAHLIRCAARSNRH